MFLQSPKPLIRYTPPTCILEIYQNNIASFLTLDSTENNDKIHFKLHFDDPRLPQEEKETITGNSELLLNLREEINKYLIDYIAIKNIKQYQEKKDKFVSKTRDKNTKITLIRKGLCRHQFCYFGNKNYIINLSNTQLFDIANALDSYYQEAEIIHKKTQAQLWKKSSLIIICLGLLSFMSGLWWWRHQQQLIQQANQSNQEALENENDVNQPNLDEVIPPSPLDSSEIPEIVVPKETEVMTSRESLSPPPPTLTQPPVAENPDNNIDSTILVNNNPENEATTTVAPVNITQQQILPPPSSPPLPPPPPPVNFTETQNTVIAINSNPPSNPNQRASQSIPSSSNLPAISPINPENKKPPKLDRLPVLESNNSNLSTENNHIENKSNENLANNHPKDINIVAINASPNLNPPSELNIPLSSNSVSNLVTQDVKQYFQAKWQPPDNLQQSIEYRLSINEDGSLSRITPLGRSARIFLDVTGMPLLGETLSSSAQESVIVRLILSPDGEVRTFRE